MWKTVSVQPYCLRRAMGNKEAKALTRELLSAFLAFNSLHFAEQVSKAHKIMQYIRSQESKSVWLFQEFRWNMQEDTFRAEFDGDIRNGEGKVYAQRIEVVKNGLTQIAYSYQCTCPDHSHRGSLRPCKHVLTQVLAFLS